MKVHTIIDALPFFRNPVLTIGTFDGVHLGHRQIINQLLREAEKIGGETVIITFHPHPRKIVGTDKSGIYLINTLEEKIILLESLGIDHLVVIPFTEAFASQTAEEYVEDFLIRRFHPHTLIIGYDHRFGKGRKGDYHLLEEYSFHSRFKLIEIPQHLLDESAISSTRIRENLMAGNVLEANKLLGYTYFFEGTVTEGNKIGRTLGFPTANLLVNDPEKLLPSNGVYAVTVYIKGTDVSDDHFKGMMNIGVRPTLNGTTQVIEVNLFDFDANIYDECLKVLVKQHLRKEQKFGGLDQLKEQLEKDRLLALHALAAEEDTMEE